VSTQGGPVRLLRGVAGALLWIVAAVVGLVGVLLSVTVVLLPVGIPLLFLARKMFTTSVQLLMPKKVAHPVKSAKGAVSDAGADVGKKLRKAGRRRKSRLSLT
jgi:hypothetical protein